MKNIKTYEVFTRSVLENKTPAGHSEEELKEVCEDLFQDLKDRGFKVVIEVNIYPEISYDKSYIHIDLIKEKLVDPEDLTPENSFRFSDIRDDSLEADRYLLSYGFKSLGHGETRTEAIRNPYDWTVEKIKTITSLWWRPVTWKLNEELRPETYLRAAHSLTKKGHTRRPDELKKWADEMKIREKNQRTLQNFEEAKAFSDPIKVTLYKAGGGEFIGLFYPKIAWNLDEFKYTWTDWLVGDCGLWLYFDLGFIPADEETHRFVNDNMGGEEWYGIWYIGNLNLHLNDRLNDETSIEYGEIIQSGDEIQIFPRPEASIGSSNFGFHITDKKSARALRNFLVNVFSGKDVYSESELFPGGLLDELEEELCDKRPIGLEGFLTFIRGIGTINLNKLYRD